MRQDAQLRREIDPQCLSRLLARIEVDPRFGCWQIRGQKPRRRFRVWVGNEQMYGYKYIYESFVGTVPPGLVMDHLCHNPGCLNPAHLEPVTVAENARRGWGRMRNLIKTHCIHGHPLSGRNMYLRCDKAGRVHRECKTCAAIRARAQRKRTKQLPEAKSGDLIGAIDHYEPKG